MPLMADAPSVKRNATTLATCSGSISFPCRCCFASISFIAASLPRIGVLMKPGATATTRMPCGASSSAAERVIMITAAFAAL